MLLSSFSYSIPFSPALVERLNCFPEFLIFYSEYLEKIHYLFQSVEQVLHPSVFGSVESARKLFNRDVSVMIVKPAEHSMAGIYQDPEWAATPPCLAEALASRIKRVKEVVVAELCRFLATAEIPMIKNFLNAGDCITLYMQILPSGIPPTFKLHFPQHT